MPDQIPLFPDATGPFEADSATVRSRMVRRAYWASKSTAFKLLVWGSVAVGVLLALPALAVGAFPIAVMLVLAGAAPLFIINYRLGKQARYAFWQHYAQLRGLACAERVQPVWPVPFMRRGHSQVAGPAAWGNVAGVNAMITDYQYTTGSGKNQQTHFCTLVAYDLPDSLEARFRAIFARRNSALAGFESLFDGCTRVEFESVRFNELWRVEIGPGQDRVAVYELFDPELIELMTTGQVGGQGWEQVGGVLVFAHPARIAGAAELDWLFQQGRAVLEFYVAQAAGEVPVTGAR